MAASTYIPFIIDLYQIGEKELTKPRTIVGHGWATSPERLEENLKHDLMRQYNVPYVDFDLSWGDTSALTS